MSKKENLKLAALSGLEEKVVTWWYGGIVKNHTAKTIPEVIIFFRLVREDGTFGEFIGKRLALTHLGKVRIGSFWKSGFYLGETSFPWEEHVVQLDFSDNPDICISPFDEYKHKKKILIPQKDYPLKYTLDKNYLLKFPFKKTKTLLIPCLEYFTRCYGRSAELRRIIAIYPWEDCQRKLFPLTATEYSGRYQNANTWTITLAGKMQERDTVFLAHVNNDEYAKNKIKNIYAQIESQIQKPNDIAFIKIFPWFNGKATMKVRGVWIDSNQTFLVLRILGSSDPLGPLLVRIRTEKENDSDEKQNSSNRDEKMFLRRKDSLELTEDVEPDRTSGITEMREEVFEVLGAQREIVEEILKKDSKSIARINLGPGVVSTGEKYGSGKGVGQADVYSPVKMPSEGILFDLWNAFHFLKKKCFVLDVEWYSPSGEFSSVGIPNLISLRRKGEPLSSLSRWGFVDIAKKRARGALVLRITSRREQFYVIEVERREIGRRKDVGEEGKPEESLRGMIIRDVSERDFIDWLPKFLPRIVASEGVLLKILEYAPGKAKVFKHTSAKTDRVPLEGVARHLMQRV